MIGVQEQRASMHATLHALSQPLTVVGLALALAQSSSCEAERNFALEAAMAECTRAMESVRELRRIVDGEAGTTKMVPCTTAQVSTEVQHNLGGMA